MQTKQKEQEHLKNNLAKATLVKAMAEMVFNSGTGSISVPTKYKDQVIAVKELLRNDVSGLVNSILDFAISCGIVDFSVETDNAELTELCNTWLGSINEDLRGQIPTGLKALQKEYLRERWKGSSFLLLRSIWERRDGFLLPTKLWFVNGENIVIDDKSDTTVLGGEKYLLQLDKRTQKFLPSSKDEKIFIQKPYESWGTTYPTPYLIRRGIYKNLKLLEALTTKGEFVVTKALEYLLLLKKGTEQLALANQSDFTYSSDELKSVKAKIEEILQERKMSGGVPTYVANFDTELEHMIPEYEKALKQELYNPIERRLLAGLGMVDVLQGVSSTRRESVLNPRPFIAEVEASVKDFKVLLEDILETIIQLNRVRHPNHAGIIRKIHSTPITQFITDDIRNHFRSMYDKGAISRQTYVEVVGDCDIIVEYNRRKNENTPEIKETFYPPVTVNQEQYEYVDDGVDKTTDKNGNDIPEDKLGEEKKNYKASLVGFPDTAVTLWDKVFEQSLHEGEDVAAKIAHSVLKRLYKFEGGSWVLKKRIKSSTGMFSLSEEALESDTLDMELKRMQVEIAKKLLKEE